MAATSTLSSALSRSTRALALLLGGFLSGACGGAPEAEGSATTLRDEQAEAEAPEPSSAQDATPSCNPAGVSLVGRYSLTRYPGQDAVGPNGERPLGMSKEYEFREDSYTMEGYPPLRITGRYEVLERDGLRLRVRFFDTVFDGRPGDEREIWVVFEECGRTLQMDGMTFARSPAE